MERDTAIVTIAGLLHDVGKVIFRAGSLDGRSHSTSGADFVQKLFGDSDITECVRLHHKADLAGARPGEQSPAYVTYIADNIASGADRRDIEGVSDPGRFDKHLPLSPVFNILNGHSHTASYPYKSLDDSVNYPVPEGQGGISESEYNGLVQKLREDLKAVEPNERYINSILEIAEARLSYVPSSTMTSQLSDISLFDHSKITAAVSACILEYLKDCGVRDYRTELLENEAAFLGKKAFLMFSGDFSGIQKFIYTIRSKDALKSLRARSFFLEMLLEHIADEILTGTGLSRANLIYTGGGHCYMLLPNTDKTKEVLDQFTGRVNRWLRKNFGTSLYFAGAYRECSGSDLMNRPEKDEPYKQIYRDLSRMLSQKKLSRYSADELRELNSGAAGTEGRECKVCGSVDGLHAGEELCRWCAGFADISGDLIREDMMMLTSAEPIPDLRGLPLPSRESEVFLSFAAEGRAREELKNNPAVIRVYSKNRAFSGLGFATRIYMGDYTPYATLEELAARSEGIERIAVLRADVDNLGRAFTEGFERTGDDPAAKNRYVTLSRTAAFSRQLSLFFKFHINAVLRVEFGLDPYRLGKTEKSAPRNVVIVYSGGDDVFLIGAWNEVVAAALDIRIAFERFTLGTLTLSGGLGLYDSRYPVYKSAYDTQQLEETAKAHDGKNALALFKAPMHTADDAAAEEHVYGWDEFERIVLGEKFALLDRFFGRDGQERGAAFLYRLLGYLRSAEHKINIARFAYMLARLEPKKSSPAYPVYSEFSDRMYRWILSEKDRRQLVTAIYLYTYTIRRKAGKQDGQCE